MRRPFNLLGQSVYFPHQKLFPGTTDYWHAWTSLTRKAENGEHFWTHYNHYYYPKSNYLLSNFASWKCLFEQSSCSFQYTELKVFRFSMPPNNKIDFALLDIAIQKSGKLIFFFVIYIIYMLIDRVILLLQTQVD